MTGPKTVWILNTCETWDDSWGVYAVFAREDEANFAANALASDTLNVLVSRARYYR